MGTSKVTVCNCYFLPNMFTELWRIREVEGEQNFYRKMKNLYKIFRRKT